MIKVVLDGVNVAKAEKLIVNMLLKSIEQDTDGLSCEKCSADSQVILHVDNSKMHVLRTEVKPCCSHFEEVIESSLFEVEHA